MGTLDPRWKNPQGNSPEQLYLWAQDLIKELRKGDYLDSAGGAADMADSTIKGRAVGAGTGPQQDLTPAQAAAVIAAFVGDSGSGGVKGEVPAPAAGDAAAGKFLRASGGWAAPPTSGAAPAVEVRTASATITIPASVTKLFVYLVGGAGGGGGAKGATVCCIATTAAGGPGGGGAGLLKYLSGLTAGLTLALTIGANGTGGAATPANGTAGGNTTLASGTQSITTLTAAGGALGALANAVSGAGGAGGTATNGDSNHTGQAGIAFRPGGSTASIGGDPGIGLGAGGATVNNGAAGTNVTGNAGTGFGGGGSGGCSNSTAAGAAGGNGAPGGAVLFWFA